MGGDRNLIIATDSQLSLLSNVKTWYVDATFHIIRQPLYRLFTVDAFVQEADNMKQVPLVQVVMAGRRKDGHSAVIQAIKDILPRPLRVQLIVMGFEDAMWRAACDIIPEVDCKGSTLHFVQTPFRKAQALGLQPAYTSDNGRHSNC
ncbi:hypothetical protein LSH36_163g04053 [Paralvinella palmiformis]|uniref:Uncharacterized protein n=1 Tax=Paralvinella palmiformis TaxID=53620 RepID=A0AAD9JUU9_9ANNE|nr:hypothetical protein LSH36_163g04053 [Paralvinella palmiformis]